jgi:hypothetical protein
MKTLTLIVSFLCSLNLSLPAQHRLTSNLNLMRPGDEIIKQQVEYKDPGRSGENVLWDFGKLTPVKDEYTLTYSYGKDSVITGTEHHTMYYYALSGDSLSLRGYENTTTIMKNDRPELLLKFPVHYGDSVSGYYSGNGRYSGRLKISAMGTASSKADAYGMIVLPDRDTLKHVIRVRTCKVIAETTEPLLHSDRRSKDSATIAVSTDSIDFRLSNDSVLLITETYRWYAKGYRYPIFETVKSITDKQGEEQTYFDVAFFYPPQEHYYLSDDPGNLVELFDGEDTENPDPGLNPNPGDAFSYNFYPNPVTGTLTVEYYAADPVDVEISIFDLHGKTVHSERKQQQTGIHAVTVDVQSYAKGSYVLKITAGETTVSEVIIKK